MEDTNRNHNSFILRDVYQLIDSTRRELNISIKNLDDKFTILEEGRLSSLEKQVANMVGRMTVIAGVTSFFISVILLVLNHFWK